MLQPVLFHLVTPLHIAVYVTGSTLHSVHFLWVLYGQRLVAIGCIAGRDNWLLSTWFASLPFSIHRTAHSHCYFRMPLSMLVCNSCRFHSGHRFTFHPRQVCPHLSVLLQVAVCPHCDFSSIPVVHAMAALSALCEGVCPHTDSYRDCM